MADCASCGKPLDAGARFCRHCGAAVPDRDAAPSAGDPTLLPGTTASTSADDASSRDREVAEPEIAEPEIASAAAAAAAEQTPPASEDTVLMPAGAVEDEASTERLSAGAGEPTQALPANAADTAEQTTASLPAGRTAGGWSCAACGAPAAADDLFCGRCGAARPQAAVIVCAACGAPLDQDMEYCPRCGARRGQFESAASRAETTVLPAAAYMAHAGTAGPGAPRPAGPNAARPAGSGGPRPGVASMSPPPPPLLPQQQSGKNRGGRIVVIIVAILVLAAIAAGVYFGFFYHRGGPQDATAPIEPIIAGLVPEQEALNDDLQALTADEQSFAAAAESAQELGDAVAQAQDDADAILVDDREARDILAAFQRALDAQAEYASALADLPGDPLDFTAAEADIALTRAGSAKAAYDDLAELAPDLPEMPFPEAATDQLAAVADEVEQQAEENAALQSFLQEIEALFPDSQSERLAAEDIVAQLEATEIPPDNAAGQMAAQAVRLRGVVGQIDTVTPPDDQRAQQIQATYREAVQHWVTAARQYAKWMRNLHAYYQVSGDWPPLNGIEADTYLDPAYESAREAVDLATATRERLAGEVDELAGEVGGTTGFTADDM